MLHYYGGEIYLRPITAKTKDLIVPKTHEGEEPPDYVHTACYLYECTTEQMKDKRWGLRQETGGGAGNPENGTNDAVWMPILEAYTLTEQSLEEGQPASFLTGILASHLLGDETLAKKIALIAVDSLRRRHPLHYPPEWDNGLEQEKLIGKGIKAWVINLGVDALGAAHVYLYRNRKGEWHWPAGEKGATERHREATSRITSKQLGIIIPPEAWQHIGEEDNAGNITQN